MNPYDKKITGLTIKDFEDMVLAIESKKPKEIIGHFGKSVCEEFVKIMGKDSFLFSVRVGHIIPIGQDCIDYIQTLMT